MSTGPAPELTRTSQPAQDVPEAQPEASYRPSTSSRVRFTPEQQLVFDREFRRREAKIRRELDSRLCHAVNDVMELVWVAEQLLFRKLNPQQAQEIARGVEQIKREYRSAKETTTCQTLQ